MQAERGTLRRAFFEIRAMGVVHVLRWGLSNLDRLIAGNTKLGLRNPLPASGVRVRDQQTLRLG